MVFTKVLDIAIRARRCYGLRRSFIEAWFIELILRLIAMFILLLNLNTI